MKNKRIGMIIVGVIVVMPVFIGISLFTGNIGISKSRIQQDARTAAD